MSYILHLNEVKSIAWNVFNLKVLVSEIHFDIEIKL
jgi:hypothetical protein